MDIVNDTEDAVGSPVKSEKLLALCSILECDYRPKSTAVKNIDIDITNILDSIILVNINSGKAILT